MSDERFEYEPIGVIRTPFESPDGMPIQPEGEDGAVGTIEVDESYGDALRDLDGFSHCILLYHFHASDDEFSLGVEPFLDDTERGLFATRAPRRPNAIGLSVVQIETVGDATMTVEGVDVVDGTPLLDIKPLVPEFDVPDAVDSGWLAPHVADVESQKADDRFL